MIKGQAFLHGERDGGHAYPLCGAVVMKLAIFGSSLTSAYANGATTFFQGLCRALHRQGWEVCFWEETSWPSRRNTRIDWAGGITVRFYHREEPLSPLLSSLAPYRVILKFTACGSRDQEIEEGLLARRLPHQILLWVDGDAPVLLPPVLQDPAHYWWRLVPRFDGVLLLAGGARAGEEYRRLGAQRVYFSASGVDPHAFAPQPPDPSWACDLLFVGNHLPDRMAQVKRLFFAVAEQRRRYRFLLAGAGWKGVSLPPNVRYPGSIPPAQLPTLYSSARLVLNLTRTGMARYGYAPSSRLFEAAACGACILTDSWEGLTDYFCPPREIRIVHTPDQVCQLLDRLTPAECQKIGEAARQRVLRDHTFTQRVRVIEQVVEEIGGLERRTR
ncbi:MAG: hypothetical protein D6736_22090 [Nitrospinota bacterium]|nr:MAG: hypothetical protein D6736_22090 [Nitrospinota bacterium]